MKKAIAFTLLFLVCAYPLQAQYFSIRSRVIEDMPPFGSRLDLSHDLVKNKDLHSVFLFNQPSGKSNFDLSQADRSRPVIGYGIPYYLDGAASPNDPTWDGNTGWRFRSAGGGTSAQSNKQRIIDVNWTIAMWVMITADAAGPILMGMSGDNSLVFAWNSANPYKGFAALQGAVPPGPTYAVSKRIAEMNKLHHVVATATVNSNIRLYVDNEIQIDGLAKTGATQVNFVIGGDRTGSNPTDFVIYALYIWNEPLTAADVELLYLDPYCIIEKPVDGVGVWAAISEAAASQVIIVR